MLSNDRFSPCWVMMGIKSAATPKIKKIKINPKDNAKWWYNLSLEDKQKAFYAVISRMHKAEIQENNNYRDSLYNVFKFGADMYDAGIECGYRELQEKLEELPTEELKKIKPDQLKYKWILRDVIKNRP